MLKDRIAEDLKDAMRAKDEVRRRTLRALRAALMQAEIGERKGGEAQLTEQQELAVVRKQAKQRRDAMEQFAKAGRPDLAEKEQEELDVIKEYLPAPLSDEELRKILHEIITEVGARSRRDMGKVMGQAMKRLRGRADGHRVQQQVQQILSGMEVGSDTGADNREQTTDD